MLIYYKLWLELCTLMQINLIFFIESNTTSHIGKPEYVSETVQICFYNCVLPVVLIYGKEPCGNIIVKFKFVKEEYIMLTSMDRRM